MDYGTFVYNLDRRIRGIINRGIHTAFPAILESYNQETGLARVVPQIQYISQNGEYMDYPPLNDVPVVFPQAMSGSATIAYPIKKGDGCLVICSEQCLDLWRYGKQTGNNLKFNISNAICIVGVFCKPNDAMNEAIQNDAVVVKVDEAKVVVKRDEINIVSPTVNVRGNVNVDGRIIASGDVVASDSVSLTNHTHTDSVGGTTTKPN